MPGKPGGKPDDPITAVNMYPRFRDFLKPLDRIVLESGSMSSGMVPLPLPEGAEVQLQPLWGSIGWATGATLGIALADPSRRTVLFTGEGSHQMTAADVGTMARNGLKPVIFVLNNGGYMVERALEADPDWVYNDLAPWNYHALPAALGCRGWFTAKVATLGELDAALAGPPRANRRATSRSSEAGWTSRRDSPWPISASTPCTAMARGHPAHEGGKESCHVASVGASVLMRTDPAKPLILGEPRATAWLWWSETTTQRPSLRAKPSSTGACCPSHAGKT